jgi:hypothetical protein
MTLKNILNSLLLTFSILNVGDAGVVQLNSFTLVVEEGTNEATSIGSYSIRVFNDEPLFGDFVDGIVAKRDGIIEKTWLSPPTSQKSQLSSDMDRQ